MLFFGPILLAGLCIVFMLVFGVAADAPTVAASHISPTHEGPSEEILWLWIFFSMIALSLLFGFLLWLFMRKRNFSLLREFSSKNLFR
jgi:flagellar biogenesis protein FliO